MAEALIRTTFTREPRPGDTIRGDIRIPDGPPPRSAVVVVHGFKGFKDWGFFPHTCDRLAAAGHAVVSFNLSHNGVGAGLHDFDELESFASNTLSMELDEVLGIVDEVMEGDLLPHRPRALGMLGHSRGGGQTILAASEDPRISAIVTWAAVGTFDRWTEETRADWRENGRIFVMNARTGQQMPLDLGLLEDFEVNRERLDIPAAAARLTQPWLIVHGRVDLTVHVDEAKQLAEVAKQGKLLLVDRAGHTLQAQHPFEESPPELERAIDAAIAHFDQHLSD